MGWGHSFKILGLLESQFREGRPRLSSFSQVDYSRVGSRVQPGFDHGVGSGSGHVRGLWRAEGLPSATINSFSEFSLLAPCRRGLRERVGGELPSSQKVGRWLRSRRFTHSGWSTSANYCKGEADKPKIQLRVRQS